ncbi:MAG TPA: trypsin-like serine protease, partial [Allosphingosinicella sp.]|nr:trypsin-like serine protease [Allosphingosinicella sp.]
GGTGGYCTLGYAVSFTSGGVTKQGILTAGHCYASMKAYLTDHDVTFSDPLVRKPAKVGGITPDNVSDKWDYLIWETTGLGVSSTISYVDKSSIPEFPASGTLKLTGISTFLNQKAGMVVCKSGHTTGLTCGEITNGNATHDGVTGWIEASKSKQALFADQGDSGGPVFYYPGTSTTITGVGITTASNLASGVAGTMIYMPIDYIDDHFSTVNTIKN